MTGFDRAEVLRKFGRLDWPVAGIRSYLVVFMLAMLLPLLAFIALLSFRIAASERAALEAQRVGVTNNLTHLVDREIGKFEAVLLGLSASPDLAGDRREAFQAQADAVAQLNKLERITVIRPSQQPVDARSASTDSGLIGPDLLASVLGGQPVVSNVQRKLDLREGQPMPAQAFAVCVPVAIGGRVEQAVCAVVDAGRLQPLFSEARLPPDWVAAVVDRAGAFLARSRSPDRYVGQLAHPSVLRAVLGSATEGLFDNVTLEGIPTASAFQRAPSGWTVVVATPTAILNAPRNHVLGLLGISGLTLLMLGVGAATLLGNRIAKGTRALQAAAFDVIEGRLPSPLPYPISELQEVSAVFDFTASMVAERKATERQLLDSEERLRLVMEAGAFGIWDLDVPSGQALWSADFFTLLGYQPASSGSATLPMWHDLVHGEDLGDVLSKLEHARTTRERFVSEHRIHRKDTAQLRWLRMTGQFHYNEAGMAVRFVGAVRDVTERKRIESDLRASEARYKAALVVGRIGSWEANFDTGQRLWSPEAQALFGLTLKNGLSRIGGDSDEFRGALHPDDRHLIDHFHKLAHEQDSFPAEYRIVHPDGTVIWVSGRGMVVAREADGRPKRLINVVADITDRKAMEEHVTFLMREISHRSKNLLSIIQAIAGQTIRTSATLSDFEVKFSRRLQGMATSHDILVTQNWTGAPLGELVRQQMAPFDDRENPRVEILGPEFTVQTNAAQAIGLALHELATNAAKFGALSVPGGRVAIRWDVEEGLTPGLSLSWSEFGGPPVRPPSRRGFGYAVIQNLAAKSVNGSVSLEFAPEGVRWSLHVPTQAHVDPAHT